MTDDSTRADEQDDDDELEDLTPEEGSADEVTGGADHTIKMV